MIGYAVVLCSRVGSSRVKAKCFTEFEGKPMIAHLLERLKSFKVFLAVPPCDVARYEYLESQFPNVTMYAGEPDNPLQRTSDVAKKYDIANVIRVCHDKIFVDDCLMDLAIAEYEKRKVDYLYSSHFTEGSGFEIIKSEILHSAAEKHRPCEHISYAICAETNNLHNFDVPEKYRSSFRLLVDFPEDTALMRRIPMNLTLPRVLDFLRDNESLAKINKLPQLTIYTCAYNASAWVSDCISSILTQRGFKEFEYIFIDDCSTDNTVEVAKKKIPGNYRNVTFVKNEKNIGLAASSNKALEMARGRYVMRIDADDYFQYQDAAFTILNYIDKKGYDAVYCGNQIERPNEKHHIGGAIFSRRQINMIKFSDRLRGYEGYDFFLRAKDDLKIGYFYKPLWFYRQHSKAMSKNNLIEREEIKRKIDHEHNRKEMA